MKLTYYHYYLVRRSSPTGQRYLCDILPFLQAFCQYRHPSFKNSFEVADGEFVYLLNVRSRLFLFLQTRNQDIIKTIDTQNTTCEDLRQQLQQNQAVSFASCAYFHFPFYALASTLKGPKNTVLLEFLNKLLVKVESPYQIESTPFANRSSREEVLRLPVIGRTTFEVDPNHGVGRIIRGVLGMENTNGISSIEVTIKPRRNGNLVNAADNMLAALEDQGLQKLVVRAKADLDDQLTDFYITQGSLSDLIEGKTDTEILHSIQDRVNNNPLIDGHVAEAERGGIYAELNDQIIIQCCEPNGWISRFGPPE